MAQPKINTIPKLDLDGFRKAIDQNKVTCRICGHKDFAIIDHLLSAHNMTAKKYRDAYPDERFASPIVSEILKRISRTHVPLTDLEDFLPMFINKSGPEVLEALPKVKVTDPELLALIPEVDPYYEFDPMTLKKLLYGAEKGEMIYIEGPTGCGKTEGALQMLARTGRPCKRVNMNGEVTADSFLGSEVAKNNQTHFEEGILIYCMRKGIPLIIDEVDFMPPYIASALHPVMERSRSYTIMETKETIKAAPGFFIIATANTGGKGDENGVYTGTEIQNTAYLTRYGMKINMDYLDAKKEVEMLLRKHPNARRVLVERLVKLGTEVRQAFKTGKMTVTFGTRQLLSFLDKEPVFGVQEALDMTLLAWLSDSDRSLVDGFVKRVEILKV